VHPAQHHAVGLHDVVITEEHSEVPEPDVTGPVAPDLAQPRLDGREPLLARDHRGQVRISVHAGLDERGGVVARRPGLEDAASGAGPLPVVQHGRGEARRTVGVDVGEEAVEVLLSGRPDDRSTVLPVQRRNPGVCGVGPARPLGRGVPRTDREDGVDHAQAEVGPAPGPAFDGQSPRGIDDDRGGVHGRWCRTGPARAGHVTRWASEGLLRRRVYGASVNGRRWVWVARPEFTLLDGEERPDLDPARGYDPEGWWTAPRPPGRAT